jgi:hypothetical protein
LLPASSFRYRQQFAVDRQPKVRRPLLVRLLALAHRYETYREL